MKKGFTLIELISVIIIMGLIIITVIPSVLNQVKGKEEDISITSEKIIKLATLNYIDKNSNIYPKTYDPDSDGYCIKLEDIVNAGELQSPLKDTASGNEIPLNIYMKIMVNEYNDYYFDTNLETERLIYYTNSTCTTEKE